MKLPLALFFHAMLAVMDFLIFPTADGLSAERSVFNPPTFSPNSGNPSVIIVGGGPVGLAAALTLSHPPHNCQVTVLEKSNEATSQSSYDPARAYLYNINPRGLAWFDRMEKRYRRTNPNLESPLSKLTARGYAPPNGMPTFAIVPSDIDKPIKMQGAPPISSEANVSTVPRKNYWIPRHFMVQALEEMCAEFDKALLASRGAESSGSITLLLNKCITSLSCKRGEDRVQIHCEDGTSYTANLVVAADGVDSAVRNFLAKKKNKGDERDSDWLHQDPDRFEIKRYKSPSTGLTLRALQFPANFTIPVNQTADMDTVSTVIYSIKSRHGGPRNRVSIGFLPIKDPTLVRPGNFILRPNHELAALKTGKSVKAWIQDAFPRLKWDELISEQEWDRFAQSNGTTYPFCQYSPGSAVWNEDGSAGVVLVGDACHAFPPDIGEGINAGIQDVVALDQSLRGKQIQTTNSSLPEQNCSTFPLTLGVALGRYQSNRRLEHKALIRLARFGFPYQYRQPLYRDRIGRFLWTLNVAFRMLLNKLSRGKVPPAAIVMAASESALTYRQIMQRADATSMVLKGLAAVFVGLWMKRVLPL